MMTITRPLAFPFSITIPPDTRIELYPDGTWSGASADKLEAALKEMRGLSGMQEVVIWLLLRELLRSEPPGNRT